MENRPPAGKPILEPTPDRRGARWPAHSSAPPWLWLLLVGGFVMIFWQFMPKAEIKVDFSPWFLDQVDSNNIRKLSIRGNEARGELRQERPHERGSSAGSILVRRFITYFPGEPSIEPVITKLRHANKTSDPVWIETNPSTSDQGMLWIWLVIQTILIVVLLFRVDSLHARLPR
jgi:cell division protease FtsH